MSVVIVGGNECMTRRYKEICGMFNCKAKVYHKMSGSFKNFGTPDLMVVFTDTVSHKMIRYIMSETKNTNTVVARCHNCSACALKTILENYTS